MRTVHHLFVNGGDHEYADEPVWDVRGYRGSRFHALMREGGMVAVRLNNGEEIEFPMADLVVKSMLECVSEFGEHDDHTDCGWMLDAMSPDYPDERDPGWYDEDAGLRWSDFIEGPIGD